MSQITPPNLNYVHRFLLNFILVDNNNCNSVLNIRPYQYIGYIQLDFTYCK